MWYCLPLNVFRYQKKVQSTFGSCSLVEKSELSANHREPQRHHHRPRRSATIEVQAAADGNADIWRAAALSFDEDTDENVVSRQLVTEILRRPIYPLNKEMRAATQTSKNVDGYTELVWCMANNSRRIHTSLAFVSAEYSPRYDVVLGRDDMKHMEASAT
jgi:hypothetical protein